MAQFYGGNNDGSSNAIMLIPSVYVYSGGNGAGSSSHYLLLPPSMYVYNGGNDEGSSNTNMLIPSIFVYTGGNNDGSANSSISLPPNIYVFNGGSDEGSSNSDLLIPSVYVYAGGNDDGSSNGSLLLPPSIYVYNGGDNEGSSNADLLVPSVYVYTGGNDDGSSNSSLLFSPNIYVYSGGDDDGSSNADLLVPSIYVYTGGNDDGATFFVFAMSGYSTFPIELLGFTAMANGDQVDLNWKTASETNNDYFTIEKSQYGMDWTFVGELKGAGNSNSMLMYDLMDYEPFSGLSYYRLKQTDFDGAFSYSEVRSVRFVLGSTIVLYPNPTNGRIVIEADKDELKKIQVYNSIGKDVTKLVSINSISDGKKELDLSTLASGLYIIRTQTVVNTVIKK